MCNYYMYTVHVLQNSKKAVIIQKGKGKNKGPCSDAMLVVGIV